MKYIINLVISSLIFFLFAENGILISVDKWQTALLLALTVSVIATVLNFLAGLLIATGCFTFAIGFIVGFLLLIFSMPIAIYYSQDYINGVTVPSFMNAFLLSLVIIFVQMIFSAKTKG